MIGITLTRDRPRNEIRITDRTREGDHPDVRWVGLLNNAVVGPNAGMEPASRRGGIGEHFNGGRLECKVAIPRSEVPARG